MRVAWVTSLLFAVGCASLKLTPAGAQVRITVNTEATRGCKYLGDVQAPVIAQEGDERIGLANAAAKKGGNVVLLGQRAGVHRIGEVYLCEEPKPEVK